MTDDQTREAELEARITSALKRVFPQNVEIEAQRVFKIKLGHAWLENRRRDAAQGRVDLLLNSGGKHLAVLELKREGLTLTQEDVEQGMSYALLARAPLLVVTNGADTWILTTHDGQRLECDTLDAEQVATRLLTAAAAAQSAVRGAIARLLGSDLADQSIAALTARELEERTGSFTSVQPFVEGFLVPRRATSFLREKLRAASPRAFVASGPPLCGKSSVLRELAESADVDTRRVLYLDAASCTEGLFRRIANLLMAQFGWTATTEDARLWLRQVAADADHPLVLCLDEVPSRSPTLKAELDEIMAGALGDGLRVVLAVDEIDVIALRAKGNGRELTRLGRHSEVVLVGAYEDDEFEAADRVIETLGGGLVPGAQHSPELRVPWVLRAAVAPLLDDLPPGKRIVIPPMLGMTTLALADDRFDLLGEVRAEFKQLAQIYVDYLAQRRRPEEVLQALYAFTLPHAELRKKMESAQVNDLVRSGLLQLVKDAAGEFHYVVRVPALFAHDVAARLARLIRTRVDKDPEEAARWLIQRCSRIPFGDVVGAQVVFTTARTAPRAGYSLIAALLAIPPVAEPFPPGTTFMMFLPEIGPLEARIDESGALAIGDHSLAGDGAGDDDIPVAISDMDAWLILSQVRLLNAVLETRDTQSNAGASLLLTIGQCKHVLRRVTGSVTDYAAHACAGVELSCDESGIAEPVTWAIVDLLAAAPGGFDRDVWVDAAVATQSLPMINRLRQALLHLSKLENVSAWARAALDARVLPALHACLQTTVAPETPNADDATDG